MTYYIVNGTVFIHRDEAIAYKQSKQAASEKGELYEGVSPIPSILIPQSLKLVKELVGLRDSKFFEKIFAAAKWTLILE